ncbi:hypothetical protein BJ138DRAFT_1151489 [Hygrophoropsis aurantiaca]|uniref:Uncharacterized protein n=1 Tax=Hygrophoropsis aurantiaca TaxID=72124 RepID=A0ACB8ACE6_9AGAM|nr:hypothetical protein BJ138DRAFT_1151489 [Hygrophoropsis aurantiaca]
MTFVALHSISGSSPLTALTLVILLYTITLHLACRDRSIKELDSRILEIMNAFPMLGICTIAGIELIYTVKSLVTALSLLAICLLPPIFAFSQRTRLYILQRTKERDLSRDTPDMADRVTGVP